MVEMPAMPYRTSTLFQMRPGPNLCVAMVKGLEYWP